MKERLDVLLVKRGLAESREKAKAIIMSGIVYVEDQKEDKAGTTFDENAKIEVRGSTLKYVSRGGLKLEKAMTHFGVTLDQKVCMDVGASTGGFTDCMLQNGAVKVFSVDVGHGQLAWKLRNDPRVVCMEKTAAGARVSTSAPVTARTSRGASPFPPSMESATSACEQELQATIKRHISHRHPAKRKPGLCV